MVDFQSLTKKMDGALEALKKELVGLRTGRASVNLLDSITVEAYGSQMPLQQVGNINAPEARLLTVQVWDQGLVAATEKAIRESNLGLNPTSDGQTIRVPIPQLTEERRNEIAKIAHKYAEESRISVRNIRKIGMDAVKKQEKDSEISKDELKKLSDDIQNLTDKFIGKIDELVDAKEKEIKQI